MSQEKQQEPSKTGPTKVSSHHEKRPPFVRSAYNYDMDLASDASGLLCLDLSRTDQSFREECDINTIVEKFGLTGELPDNLGVPRSGDFTEVPDYQTALNLIIDANRSFMAMPGAVRERFGNDADKFVEFVSDPANLEEARRLGIADAPKGPRPPVDVRVIVDPTQVLESVRGASGTAKPASGPPSKD